MDEIECSYEQSYDGRKSGLLDRVEVRARSERRRRWSSAAKLAIVRETLAAGSTAQRVADRHGIGTGLIYTWRKQMLRAAMAGFATVEIKPDVPAALCGPDIVAPPPPPSQSPSPPPPTVASPSAVPGGIEVELPSGVRLRFGSDVDGAALQRILTALAGP
jgi:transposase